MTNSKTIIITGGGTGGHVFPALAIAEALRQKQFHVVYVGSPSGMETKLVPERGIPLITLKSGAVKNQGVLKTLASLLRVLLSVFDAMAILRREKPLAVVGVGGYVSVPVSVAAFFLRIPLFLQEQNVSVGIANRFLGKLARKVFLGFTQAEKYFSTAKCIQTGNPLRTIFYEEPVGPLKLEPIHLLVMGGSQGARAINQAMMKFVPGLLEKFPNLTVTHQTGVKDEAMVKAAYAVTNGRAQAFPFLTAMRNEYEKASLVVCRSGALTVSELLWVKRPAVFVPFPRSGQNDQVDNAKYLEGLGAAKVVEQGDQFESRLQQAVENCLNAEKLRAMGQAYSALPQKSALDSILFHLFNELGLNV